MYDGSRVTDAVDYWHRKQELKKAVSIVRGRPPERFRWRKAVAAVSSSASPLRGLDRSRVEEPVRELVLDLNDDILRREVVIDARRVGVDLDRGEILPFRTLGQMVALANQAGVDLNRVRKHVRMTEDFGAKIDVAAMIVVGRALGEHYRTKAQKLLLSVPDPDAPQALRMHERMIMERADDDRAQSQRWFAFAKGVLEAPIELIV